MMNEHELLNRAQVDVEIEEVRQRIRSKLGRRSHRVLTIAEIRDLFDRAFVDDTSRARSRFGDPSITVR